MPALIVTGLGYGDEGKGAVVDHLVRQHKASGVVFTNGGAQRGHNVATPSGQHHTFNQFSSGTFAGAKTYHASSAMVDPYAFFLEADEIVDAGISAPWRNVAVHADALITTPFHIALNRVRAQIDGHGTCGMGIGETAFDALSGNEIRFRDLHDPKVLYEKLNDAQVRLRKRAYKALAKSKPPQWLNGQEHAALHSFAAIKGAMEVYRIFAKVVPMFEVFDFGPDETIVFEGSQGVLLDEFSGFHPHTTWSKTAGQNARQILDGYNGEVRHIGVMRSYMTRHGNGPFVTEDAAMNHDERFREEHNSHGRWQGAWRRGWTDLAALKYSVEVAQPDEIAITHLDRVYGAWKICTGYNWKISPPQVGIERETWEIERGYTMDMLMTAQPEYVEFDQMRLHDFCDWIKAASNLPVSMRGLGQTYRSYGDTFRAPAEAPI